MSMHIQPLCLYTFFSRSIQVMLYNLLTMQLVTIFCWLMSSILTACEIKSPTFEPCPCNCFQEPAFHWQKGRKGTKLEQTLPTAERLAAAQAVLSSMQAAEPLQVRQQKRLHSSQTLTQYMPNADMYYLLNNAVTMLASSTCTCNI